MPARLRHALLTVLLAAVPLYAAVPDSGAEGTGAPAAEVTARPAHLSLLSWDASTLRTHVSGSVVAAHAQKLSITFRKDAAMPLGSVLSFADQLRQMAPVRRLASDRWNTSDSSRSSDFAICYRFSRMMGLQVIPGDLTPSKLPTPKMLSVKSYGSGMGVMAGMTLRLGRLRK